MEITMSNTMNIMTKRRK